MMLLRPTAYPILHPISFAEDVKLRPGEDVTSPVNTKNLKKIPRMCEAIWPTWQVVEIKKENNKKRIDTPTPQSLPRTPRKLYNQTSKDVQKLRRDNIPVLCHLTKKQQNRKNNKVHFLYELYPRLRTR